MNEETWAVLPIFVQKEIRLGEGLGTAKITVIRKQRVIRLWPLFGSRFHNPSIDLSVKKETDVIVELDGYDCN